MLRCTFGNSKLISWNTLSEYIGSVLYIRADLGYFYIFFLLNLCRGIEVSKSYYVPLDLGDIAERGRMVFTSSTPIFVYLKANRLWWFGGVGCMYLFLRISKKQWHPD